MLRKPQGIADLSVTETLSDQYGYLPFTRRDAAELLGLGWAAGAACVCGAECFVRDLIRWHRVAIAPCRRGGRLVQSCSGPVLPLLD